MIDEVNTSVVDGYFGLINTLSNANRNALIDKLVYSEVEKQSEPYANLKESFGAWESDQTADEMIADIRNSRLFTREIDLTTSSSL